MILTLIEHAQGALSERTLEMLTLARTLAKNSDTMLEAILIGEAGDDLAGQLAAYGVSRAHLIQHESLSDYAPDAWAQSMVQVAEAESPIAVFAPSSERGNEVLARVAAKMSLPMVSNCVEIEPGDPCKITRTRWGGSLLEEATYTAKMKLFTVAPFMVTPEEAPISGELELNTVTPTLDDKDLRVRVVEKVPAAEGVSITDASVVVGGGRGVGSPEGFGALEELAELLDGVVGCSRVATDSGWRSHSVQVGQTGARISPDLYIACGISGATQHWVGCMGSEKILTINTDPEAAMVIKADYAIIGDLHEVLPALSAELRKLK
ncbi:MAG: electron transfer flavoprotein subunit alpha/FixB family protein [Anaerolineae bacterium]|jgi:electron transfer flavoprotein alpha subunit|nr:electron transfer flavoprotein subunit alpha/FixB family protein [Anaerolineae bacterium]MBT4311380.1 electron transfer flavoprotein subunit alpha/FixB family protein [Anaerolineae bacterium]MBT4459096.1 electron transfer flavoprotein subunit alpha/FixB family protein [Anaerolineae bacterium]MBT6063055.1 electron transfer flavoprotein subunit alpha/FixB family protein [Anaerolineae bacterium]MBT6322728.1 electron transfer flavoprotein subunit alpha/FixB family protein [Anaerolineae bacterium